MKDVCYYYCEKENITSVSILGPCISLCLTFVNKDTACKVLHIGALYYRHFGYATVDDIPEFGTVRDVLHFFETEAQIGLLEFEIELENIGVIELTSDKVIHGRFVKRHYALALIESCTYEIYSQYIISQVINNQGRYISFDDTGLVSQYASFKHFKERSIQDK